MTGILLNTFYLGLGGFLGTAGRYWTGYWMTRLLGENFPWGTITVNLIGSFFIGFLMVLLTRPALSHPGFRLFFIVGLMGGFTTYSSFSLDNLKLLQDGRYLETFLYAAGTFLPGLALVYLGTLTGSAFLHFVMKTGAN